MIILYRLPGTKWDSTRTLDPDELLDYIRYLRDHRFTVTTVEEFDYLGGLSLMLGQQIPVDFDPTGFRCTNVTQLKIMGLGQ